MAYVITDACIKDSLCTESCPSGAIHPQQDEPGYAEATQLYVDPAECLDCGGCVPACTSDAIHPVDDVPEEKNPSVEVNAAYFNK